MGMNIWYGEGDEDALSLGDPGTVFRVFAEVGRVVGDDPAFDELQSVPVFAEQTVTPWWLSQVRNQSRTFLHTHGADVSDDARRVLTILARDVPTS